MVLVVFTVGWMFNTISGQTPTSQPRNSFNPVSEPQIFPTPSPYLVSEFFTQTDLNCDGIADRLTLTRDLNFNDQSTGLTNGSEAETQGIEGQIIGLNLESIVKDKIIRVWQFSPRDVGGSYLWKPILLSNSGCEKLLAIVVDGGVHRTFIFRWDSEKMETLVDAPGYPIQWNQEAAFHKLEPGERIEIRAAEQINPAKCSTIVTSYEWDGDQFLQVSQYGEATLGCGGG
jgi:hypothetical protein